MYVVDTSVWAEILLGSQLGKRAKDILEKNECFALDITFAELSKWCISNNFNPLEIEALVEKSCNGMLGVSKRSFLRAGMLWHTVNSPKQKGRQVGLIDCIVAATAEENGFGVFTKDRHFARFAQVKKEML
ncbi:MAG TPA: PIN domain-containing protein [archaeon]|nr:PIN domain-containing protein [archaeon]